MTYLLIRMHSRNVRVIVYIWKPIEYILTYFEEQWSTKASMVNVFSTFFLLTYVKLISVSFTLLLPTYMYDIHGNCIGAFLYYDASIPYFGREHLPYAIIAINIASEKAFELIYFSAILSSIVGILPLLCGIAVILRWLSKKTSRFSRLCKLLKLKSRTNYSEYEPLEDSAVPHRMDHPEQYNGRAANSAIQILI